MVHAVAVATADHAHLIRQPRHVRQEIADLDAALPVPAKRFHGAEQRVLRDFAPRFDRTKTGRQRLARVANEFGLRIKQIHMARPTVHEEPDHPLRLRGKMRPRFSHEG